nr:VOC family protein [Streptomyces alboflavus]
MARHRAPQAVPPRLRSDDIEAEQRRVLDLGATLKQDFIGPNGYGWRIYTDPIGHPFCLCRNKGVVWTDQGPVWPERD